MLFISDAQYYIPIKLCRAAGCMHLFKNHRNITFPKHIKLNKNILWDITEMGWREVNMTLHLNKIKLPTSVLIPL